MHIDTLDQVFHGWSGDARERMRKHALRQGGKAQFGLGTGLITRILRLRRERWSKGTPLGISVIAGCHPPPIFQAAKHDLDTIAALISTFVIFDGLAA